MSRMFICKTNTQEYSSEIFRTLYEICNKRSEAESKGVNEGVTFTITLDFGMAVCRTIRFGLDVREFTSEDFSIMYEICNNKSEAKSKGVIEGRGSRWG